MISLPLEQINREAPYNIKGLKDGSVFFTTDNGLHYIVSFDPDDVSLMLYICETGDGKQAMRNRLFQYWYSHYERKQEFTFLSTSIKDEEGVINYATLIIRNDNPDYAAIVNEFALTINVLNEKPKE